MEGWPEIAFTKCIVKHGVKRNNQINSSEVEVTGMFPVVDQGKSFIAGYTDDKSKIIRDGFPYVIFGDHTRCFKYVDFPFVLGADGTKVLKPDPDAFSARFFYYAMLSLDIPSRGYNRHFQLVKEKSIPKPPLAEQRRIAAVLSLAQRAIEQEERIIVLTIELKKALMHKLFTEGTRGEPQKETEIGPIPESWEVVELGNVVDFFNGHAFKSSEAVDISNTQLVRMGNLYQNSLDLSRKPMFFPDDYGKKYSKFVLKPGDLIMSLTGTSGKEDYGFTVEINSVPQTLLLNQRVTRIDIKTTKTIKAFVLYFLLSRKFLDYLYPTAKGMKQANLSTHSMKKLKIVIPNKGEQQEISNCFISIDRKVAVHEKRREVLRSMFTSLLHQLMAAEIRVNDLDFSEFGIDIDDLSGEAV